MWREFFAYLVGCALLELVGVVVRSHRSVVNVP